MRRMFDENEIKQIAEEVVPPPADDLHYINVEYNGTMSEEDFALVQANPDKCILVYELTETQVMYLHHVKTWVSSGTPTEYIYAGCYTTEVRSCSIYVSNRKCNMSGKNITWVYAIHDGANLTKLSIDGSTYNIPQGLPAAPSSAGTYTLHCSVDSGGIATYNWVVDQ